ncbi:unnamed protein product [Vitrella brassicaformis CCMP3155]|uniref:Adenosine deaminase domain-containing protein n=2 Tax=Vitrella brassicaformis TaxID=1169539 RepID=A0A0G4G3P0_VITBC|nr:unnamed protein product [Vitrella brassicaformis CCMP3155]|eukprot:CEM22775.1 unnamed protein product [Vitrella brassicaformis CCMP3155]
MDLAEEGRPDLTESQRAVYAAEIPKAELHVHIEGCLSLELLFRLAAKNRVRLPFASIEEAYKAYQFTSLSDFLDSYYLATKVLVTEDDFRELALCYMANAYNDGVCHAEISFDPQAHLSRGVSLETVLNGLRKGLKQGKSKYGISTMLIMCFHRDKEARDALACLDKVRPYASWISGVGLDSAEAGYPAAPFREVFRRAKAMGLRCTAHAGEEEGCAQNITESLDVLGCERIDHGIQCIKDRQLLERLVREKIPLTVCPISNAALRVVPSLKEHPARDMLHSGLKITLNSDDPPYNGPAIISAYWAGIGAAYKAAATHLGFTRGEILQVAINSIEASWLSADQKKHYLKQIAFFDQQFGENDGMPPAQSGDVYDVEAAEGE